MRKSFISRKMLAMVSVVLLGIIFLGFNNLKGEKVLNGNNQGGPISLEFVEIPIEPLNLLGEEMGSWVAVKSIPVEGLGPEGTSIQLLIPTEAQGDYNQDQVRGILVSEKAKYDLGDVGSYGLADVEVAFWDVTNDSEQELIITGGLGAAYRERKIISYDANEDAWVTLLTMGSPWDGDLDGDGHRDLVAVSNPGYVWVYRWNGHNFEMADLVAATGNYYAHIVERDNEVWIESGKPHEQPKGYLLRADKLVKP